jgi:hypothetical protein
MAFRGLEGEGRHVEHGVYLCMCDCTALCTTSVSYSEINQSSLKTVSTKTTRNSIIFKNFRKNSKRSQCDAK